MTDLWGVLAWAALGTVGICATVLGIALWLDTPDVVPFGDLTWDADDGEAMEPWAPGIGAATEAPGVLTIHAATDAEAADQLVRRV